VNDESDISRPNREAQVLSLAAEGMTDRQISGELGISLATVDTYWRRIRAKFDASSRTEAVAKALNLRSSGTITLALQENNRLILEMQQHIAFEQQLQERILDANASASESQAQLHSTLEYAWRTRLLMGSLGAVMWWAEPSPPWTIDWISDSVAQWGYEAVDLIRKKQLLSIVHEDDAVSFEAGTLLAVRGKGKPIEREYRVKTASGEIRLVRERLTSMITPVRNKPSLIGIQMDVSAAP
jgi:DNA-binding CsgD family transcriptional regulator